MTTVSRAWGRVTLPGKIIFAGLALLFLLSIGGLIAIMLLGPLVIEIVSANLPFLRFIIAATATTVTTTSKGTTVKMTFPGRVSRFQLFPTTVIYQPRP